MRIKLVNNLSLKRRGSGGGGGAPVEPGTAAAISAIAADGWQATYASPPALTPDAGSSSQHYVLANREGFTSAGASTTHSNERLVVTSRVRQAYPNHASLTTDSVSLSDYIYSTDTISGVTNNSAETSPKPVANWIMPARLVVANTVELEVVAFHRDTVACVEFRATDGTLTVTQVVAATAVSGRTGDRNAVVSYKVSLDISTLATGLVTCNAKVFPRIGGAASVLNSSDQSGGREFSPRYFLKNTSLVASPPYAYVAAVADAGNGIGTPSTSGVVSTNLATAKATPFSTTASALDALHTAYTASTGLDGCIVMYGNDNGTPHVLSSPASTRTQKVGALTLTRDPNVAQANARVSFGTTLFTPRLGGSLTAPLTTGAIRFSDLSIVRTGTTTISGISGTQMEIIFDNCTFDNATQAATWLANAHDYHFGTVLQNAHNSAVGAGTLEHRLWRGVSLDRTSTTSGLTIEGYCVIGSSIKNPQFTRGTRTLAGGIHAFNTYRDPPTAGPMLSVASDESVVGFAFVQNLVEYISATVREVLRISGDSATGSNTHFIIWNNTHAGAFQAGRWNVFYDDGTTARTTKLQSVKGNVSVAVYTKSDVFQLDGARTGNWAFPYGVGCQGNLSQFQSDTAVGQGQSQSQDYAGLGANYGTSQTTRNDPLFTTYAGTTVAAGPTYTAGAGGGTYTVSSGSPAKSMVSTRLLSHDLAGNARAATSDTAGAYA